MTSVCDGAMAIGSCAPFASQHDVVSFLQEFCKDCYGEVPAYTDEVDFCSTAFGGAGDANCDFLMVKRGTAPDEEYFISDDCINWYQITFENNVGYVPLATAQEDFIEIAWGAYADMPDPNYAPILFIVEGDCLIWIAVNDRSNCDLGTIPATPATGTDWTAITAIAIEDRLKIFGLEVDVDSTTTAVIYPGACRDDTNTLDVDNSANINIDTAGTGANGLDANDVALAANTWYRVYLIQGAAGVAGFISTSATPVLPVGYTYKRRVGWALTTAGSIFYLTEMRDNKVMYDGYRTVLNNGNIANGAYTAVSIALAVPPTTRWIEMASYMNYNATAVGVLFSRDGVTNAFGYLIYEDDLGGHHNGFLAVASGAATIYVQSTTAVAENLFLSIPGYVDDRWDT